jgi:hypothetical protein
MYICAVFIIKRNIFNMSSSSFGTPCRECNRKANPRDDTNTPYPHTGCEYEDQDPVFAFPSQSRPCLECENKKKWQENYNKGILECPYAPRVHTCEHKP